MLRGRSVGVIHSLDASLPATTVTGIGVAARVLGDAAAGRRVLDPEGEEAYGDVLEAGQELAKSGADVVVVGCTGMTRLRARLQGEPGLPVVELCQAAIIFAASALRDAYTERDRPLDRLNADTGPRDDCCDAPGRGLEHRSAFDPYLDGFVCCVRIERRRAARRDG